MNSHSPTAHHKRSQQKLDFKLPVYVGCFKDSDDDRDFDELIGTNMQIKDCFDQAKTKGFKMVGL